MTQKCEINAPLYQYMVAHSLKEPDVLARLRAETMTLHGGYIMSTPEQGQFLNTLVHISNAKNILELGTFTGYATLWMALALPEKGHIHTINVQDMHIDRCHQYWTEAGVDDKITLDIADARTRMTELCADESNHGAYDLIFIDADKRSYIQYVNQAHQLLRTGGLAIIDNVFLHGEVADPNTENGYAQRMDAFNKHMFKDDRFHMSIAPIGDGMTLAVKR